MLMLPPVDRIEGSRHERLEGTGRGVVISPSVGASTYSNGMRNQTPPKLDGVAVGGGEKRALLARDGTPGGKKLFPPEWSG
jgi:hypothetical protein